MSRLVGDLVGERAADLTVEEIREDADVSVVIDACSTPAFLSDRRVVVVRNVGRFRADEVEPLVVYLSAPTDSTSLVLVGGGGAIPTRLRKAIQEHGHIVDVNVPSGKGRQTWISDRLKNGPVVLDRRAADLVSDRLGEDVAQLSGILDALAAAYGEGASLTAEQVEPYVGSGGVSAPWELTDAIDRGDANAALVQLHRMIGAGGRHPLVLMATLQRHYGNLLKLDGSGVSSESEAASLLGVAPFPAKKALSQSRKLGSASIKRAIELLSQADVDLRGSSAWSNDLVLDVLIARLSRLVKR